MEEKEHHPAAGVSEDPDSPVTDNVSAEDVATPAADAEEDAAAEPAGDDSEAVVTNDPDAPVTVDVSEVDVASPERDAEVLTADAEESLPAAEPELRKVAVLTADPDDASVSGDREAVEDVAPNRPEEPEAERPAVDQVAADLDTKIVTADPDEGILPSEQELASVSVLTADPDESLFAPGGSDEITGEQLLVGVEQPRRNDEIARRLAVLEAIVYVTDEPLSAEQIAKAMGEPLEDIKLILDQLVAEYNRPEHGLTVREVAGGYKMATKPEHHEAVRTFVKNLNPPLKLSLAALETLAVIAYKQPITAPEIMEIRGVQGAGVLKTLLDRKLITTAGRKNVIGKPILYKTTKEFLVQFGLRDLAELPTLKEFEDLRRMAFSDADDTLADSQSPLSDSAEAPTESEVETEA